MKEILLKDVKPGEFFTLKDYGDYPNERRVYIRREYDRSEKKYICEKFSDFCDCTAFKGTKKVFVGFTF